MEAVVNLPEESTARLGRGRISALAFSPDQHHLVVGSSIGVWWYELPAMDPIALWDTERGMISAISFSPDGQWLATGDGDGVLKVWDVKKGTCVAKMDREENEKAYHLISHIVFSPDSQLLAASSRRDYILNVWDWQTGVQVAKFHDETNFRWFGGSRRPVTFSTDGRLLACTMPEEKLLACAEPDGSIRTPAHSTNFITVWDIETGKQLSCLASDRNFTESLDFSPCGKFLAAGEKGGIVQVWAIDSWQLLHKTIFNDEEYRMQISHSPEGTLYAAATSNNAVTVWDVEREKKCYTYCETNENIECTHFTKGSELVFATERQFKTWKLRNSQQSTAIHLHTSFPDSLAFSLDGKTLASGYWNNRIMLWDVANPLKYPICFNQFGGNCSVSVSSTGKIYAIGSDSNTAKVWEIGKTEVPLVNFTLPAKSKRITSATFAPTNKLLACGDSKGLLYIWDMQQKKNQYNLTAHADSISSVMFSPNEKQLVSVTRHGPMAILWDVSCGEKIPEFPGEIEAIAFSPNSDIIAGGRRKEIILWDVKQREILMVLPHAEKSWWPLALTFSPCGRYLVSGEWWQRGANIKKVAIRLWSLANGKNIATFYGHPTDIQALTFSPDGTLLASGSYDGTILLWDMTPYL